MPETQRFSIDMLPAAVEECDRLMLEHDIKTKAELFRHALSVFRVIADEVSRGHEIKCGDVRVRFPMLEKR